MPPRAPICPSMTAGAGLSIEQSGFAKRIRSSGSRNVTLRSERSFSTQRHPFMHITPRFLATTLTLMIGGQAVAGGQICPASNAVGQNGIGDGCTTSGLENIPHIALFKPTFTSSCNRHDKCYTTLGSTYSSCNPRFLSDMQSACRSDYNPLIRPVEYSMCMDTANQYYLVVSLFAETDDPLKTLQPEALKRSKAMQLKVEADECGTTPERTTLYAAGLVSQVNNSFLTYARRLPTVYEFFTAVNASSNGRDYVTDRAWWNTNLNVFASSRLSYVPPQPSYTVSSTFPQLVLSSTTSNVNHLWKVNGATSLAPSIVVSSRAPVYDSWTKIEGFMKAVDQTTSAKNMIVIDNNVFREGSCSGSPDQICR